MAKKQGLKTRRLPPCGPVDVAAVWKRIETCLRGYSPSLVANLSAGAKVKEVSAIEKAIGRKLPEEVRQSFRIHDGERSRSGAIFHSLCFSSLKITQSEWDMWTSIEGDDDLESDARDNGSSTPKGTINLGYTNRNWIQLIVAGESNSFGIDLNPGKKGLAGQVINFGRDEEHKVVLAWSWGWYLSDLADELERGNFRYSEDEDQPGLILISPTPPHGCHFNLNKQWSKAKLGGKRPFDPLSAEDVSPLQKDRTVRSVAEGIAGNGDFTGLPILADALEDAGCTDERLLDHCRNPGDHGCGCWAVDLLLGNPSPFGVSR